MSTTPIHEEVKRISYLLNTSDILSCVQWMNELVKRSNQTSGSNSNSVNIRDYVLNEWKDGTYLIKVLVKVKLRFITHHRNPMQQSNSKDIPFLIEENYRTLCSEMTSILLNRNINDIGTNADNIVSSMELYEMLYTGQELVEETVRKMFACVVLLARVASSRKLYRGPVLNLKRNWNDPSAGKGSIDWFTNLDGSTECSVATTTVTNTATTSNNNNNNNTVTGASGANGVELGGDTNIQTIASTLRNVPTAAATTTTTTTRSGTSAMKSTSADAALLESKKSNFKKSSTTDTGSDKKSILTGTNTPVTNTNTNPTRNETIHSATNTFNPIGSRSSLTSSTVKVSDTSAMENMKQQYESKIADLELALSNLQLQLRSANQNSKLLTIIEKQKRELELKDEQIKVLTEQLEFLNKKLNQKQEEKSLEASSNENKIVNEETVDDAVNAEYKSTSSLNKVSLNSLLEDESEGEDSDEDNTEEKEEIFNNNEELELEEPVIVQNASQELEPWDEDLVLEEAVVVTSNNN
jgi:hypothetical protein